MNHLQRLFEEQSGILFNGSKYKLTTHIEKHADEIYSCENNKKTLHLKAANLRTAYFGMHNLAIGIKSGHLAEHLGENKPRFAWRPLSIVKTREHIINPEISLFLPNFTKTGWDDLCVRTIELGFNSLLFPISQSMESSTSNPSVQNIFRTIQEYGLKIIVQPKFKFNAFSPFEIRYANTLNQNFQSLLKLYPEIDGVFWESQAILSETSNPGLFRDVTQQDLVEAEIKSLEKAIGPEKRRLFFYIPAPNYEKAKQQAKWISQICDNVSANTIIAFSSVAGGHFADHLPPHPFWNTLRESPDISATPLMPLVNIGSVNLGEGLWPSLSLDLIEDYISRCYRHSFAGAILQIANMPKRGALLDGALWTTSQYLWKERPPHLLLATWFLARRPELNIMFHRNLLIETRELVRLLSKIISEPPQTNAEGKMIAEHLLVRLNYLQFAFEAEKQKPIYPKISWSEYFKPFARDAKNIIHHYMLQHQIHLPSMRKEEHFDLGFWTKNGSHAKILLDEPFSAFDEKSPMRAILNENRLE